MVCTYLLDWYIKPNYYLKEFYMKKSICVILLLVCAGALFAQQKAAAAPKDAPKKAAAANDPKDWKNAVALDLFPLFKGLVAIDPGETTGFFCFSASYERQIIAPFSIGGQIDLYPGKISKTDYVYFGMNAFGRFYPMSKAFDKVFVGTSLGFNIQAIDGKNAAKDGGFGGLTVGLSAGYKLVMAKIIYIEPSMSYILSKSSIASMMGAPSPLGWQGGLRFGFAF
jgi:hypothetical protein